MSWVLISILCFIAFYTLIMAFFRKQEDPFFPYEESMASHITPLLEAENWEPFTQAFLTGEFRESDSFSPRIPIIPTIVPQEELLEITIEAPPYTLLLDEIKAAPTIQSGEPYQAEIRWEPHEDFSLPRRLHFYRRDREFLIIPPYSKGRETDNESPQSFLFINPDALAPGEYTLYFLIDDNLREWSFRVAH
ncbi:MAG: hypothetical protein LAT55_03040 [Opitutales bacterium]|nr:hypothetical protein [Opitutales bacterium]